MVETLTKSVRNQIAAGTGPALSARARAPLYVAGPDVRRVPVTLDTGPWAAELKQVLADGVPIPLEALPSSGSDGAMVIWQPATDTYWDFFMMQQALHFPQFIAPPAVSLGGSLSADTYNYKVSSLNAQGETTVKRSGATARVPAGGGTVRLRWSEIEGATGYRIYRGAGTGPLGLLATVPATTTFTDDGSLVGSPVEPPSTNTALTPGQWRAANGGRMTGVSRSPGHFRSLATSDGGLLERFNWGASATSLPLAAGMITREDLRRGRIDHALALGLPNLSSGSSIIDPEAWAFPAQRSDGKSTLENAIPEGARLRLDPTLDLDGLALTPFVRMLADAAQRHGMIVQDGSAATVIYGEDPSPFERQGAENFYDTYAGPRPPGFLSAFPWDRLQVVEMHLCSDPAQPCLVG